MKFGMTVQVATLAGVLATATACGGDASSDEVDASTWDTADPCSLATSETVESLVTTGAGEGVQTDSPDRRSCLWGNPELMNTVTVTLAALPQSVKPLRTLAVGNTSGPVLAESKYQCILELPTDSGVLSVEARFGLEATIEPDTSCDRVVPFAEHAAKELGWA